MQKSIVKCLLAAGVAALALALGTSAFAQGVTTSGINGFVTDKSGKPVDGAIVTILHEPSGTRGGHHDALERPIYLSGLRVGGPYTVTVGSRNSSPSPRRMSTSRSASPRM